MEFATKCFGKMTVTGGNLSEETFTWRETAVSDGIYEFRFSIQRNTPERQGELELSWHIDQRDTTVRWTPFLHSGCYALPPVWSDPAEVTSSLAYGMPLIAFLNPSGRNRGTMVFSDFFRFVKIRAGVYDRKPDLQFKLRLFSVPEPSCEVFHGVIRLDMREVFYADAIRDAVSWIEALPECGLACKAPETAFLPVFSSWYNYQKEIHEKIVESSCAEAARLGLKTLILDDGWQIDGISSEYAFYASCGDWNVSKKRFSDFPAHIRHIHDLGMKYMLWFSVPYLGEDAAMRSRFEKKTLMFDGNMHSFILDPRFPDVREYLISIYEKAVREWNIDGLKLDFIDCFQFFRPDPALTDGLGERDISSLPEAVDRLLADTIPRLRAIKPDILIEFRQSYIGPAIKKYGTMLRASDCPGDIVANRALTAQLRLTSGETPVHSDMLIWPMNCSPEDVARTLFHVLFSVPQISIRTEELPESHRRTLRAYLEFWNEHRDTLMKGTFTPFSPEENYPLIQFDIRGESFVNKRGKAFGS